jgi:RNA polymerase sigma-70 factor (ECF subfamily)
LALTLPKAAAAPDAPPVRLRTLYDDHAPGVMRCLRYLGVREADIDDATQETFMIAHRKLNELRPGSSYRAWLYAIALNVARHARRGKTTVSLDEASEPRDTRDASRQAEARSELMALLSMLDDDKREPILLYHLEQLTLREVAEVLGCPLQTVYSRLQAGMRQLEAARKNALEGD